MESTDSQIERPRTPIEGPESSTDEKTDVNERTDGLLISDIDVDDDGADATGGEGSADEDQSVEVEHACPFCSRRFETTAGLTCHLHKHHRKSELIDEFLAAVDCTEGYRESGAPQR